MRNWILALAGAAYFIMAAPPNDASQNPPTEQAAQTPQEVAPTVAIKYCVDASTHETGEAVVAFIHVDPTSGVALLMHDAERGVLMGTGDEVTEPVETALTLLGRHAVRA